MVVKWKPEWYELDQTIVVGDIDYFYLSEDNRTFANGFAGDGDCEVKAEILGISHLELGEVKGIITIGLDYTIYLDDRREIIVNAEEAPGEVENDKCRVKSWDFDVRLRVIEKTGLSSIERVKLRSPDELKTCRRERVNRYKALLNLMEADWERFSE